MDEALDRLLSQNVRLSEQSGLLFDDFYLQLVKVRCDLMSTAAFPRLGDLCARAAQRALDSCSLLRTLTLSPTHLLPASLPLSRSVSFHPSHHRCTRFSRLLPTTFDPASKLRSFSLEESRLHDLQRLSPPFVHPIKLALISNDSPASPAHPHLSEQFDEQLQGLKSKSSLMRVLTSNRLRKDLELLNAVVFARFKVYAHFCLVLYSRLFLREHSLFPCSSMCATPCTFILRVTDPSAFAQVPEHSREAAHRLGDRPGPHHESLQDPLI